MGLGVAKKHSANLCLSSGGALRGNSEASAGMAIVVFGNRANVLYCAGKLPGSLSSAFAAEVMAMECYFEVFCDSDMYKIT